MTEFCNQHGGSSGDPGGACGQAGFNILRIDNWSMCRNVEWMMCVINGKGSYGGGGTGEIVFTYAPNNLWMDDFNSRPWSYIEDDIYYLEICVLNEMCSNYEELWEIGVGESFFCKFDSERWSAAAAALRSL